MRNGLVILAFLLAGQVHAQSKLSIGQYSYIKRGEPFYVSPIAQYQSSSNWYAEARYNYEDLNTFSLYGGRTFSNEQALSYSITPMAGIMWGRLRGGSAGLNASLEYKKYYFSTQSQYSVSTQDLRESFFFSWSEAGYRPLDWLYTGVSLQHTKPRHAGALIEPGFFACFSYRQWSLPVYCFVPSREPCFFVVGITREWRYPQSGRSKTGKPPFPKRTKVSAY